MFWDVFLYNIPPDCYLRMITSLSDPKAQVRYSVVQQLPKYGFKMHWKFYKVNVHV